MDSIHNDQALERFRRQWKLDPYYLKRMWFALLQTGKPAGEAVKELPVEVRDPLRREFAFHCLRLVERSNSAHDGATKLVFETEAGRRLETVILRSGTGRTSLCVSSQVGCAAGCAFCATGYMDGVRNLRHDEILDQVVQARQLLRTEGRRIRNVVFMGMGEPFHNVDAVHRCLRDLQRRDRFQLSGKRILVSTVGVPEAMIRFASEFPKAQLALSLHSVDRAFRESLIPIARRYSLDELRAALQIVAGRMAGPVMIEYLLLRRCNDQPDDAEALARFLKDIPSHVNLIPYNPIAEAPHLRTTSQEERERFGEILRERGLTVTIRYSQGADIAAACGQLAAGGSLDGSPIDSTFSDR